MSDVKTGGGGEADERDLKIRELMARIEKREKEIEKIIMACAFVMLAVEGVKDATRAFTEEKFRGGGL